MENYYPSGALKSTVEWENDHQHGVAKSYYETGQLEEISHWRNDSLAGPYMFFYPNGKLNELGQYEHNVSVGDLFIFDNKGKAVQKQIYDAQGRLIYVAEYDKRGRLQDGIILPVFTDKADTITLGQTFETVVSLGFTLSGDISMIVGRMNNRTGEILDTAQVLTPNSKGRFIIQVKPDKTGEANVYYKLQHRPMDSNDTLCVNNQFGNHRYYVRPK
ncbi:toxin-antitoxin system YwqK family antitoxin [Hymenobacter sp. HDW8]|uniref:toxin-antitoxin system YwqK family antitoxin n=1 Tax=Hymenobacter sp. HDW8 TaxID=2714932 RepID=UPI0014090C8A|nr:hypothetical protein [Hymenobacter sp. HDW8]QIL74739.1 hypothetical protein G7064_01845 [Hymenobacter sp. HDW8]